MYFTKYFWRHWSNNVLCRCERLRIRLSFLGISRTMRPKGQMHGADRDLQSVLGLEYCGLVTYGKTVQSYCFDTCVVIALSTGFLSEYILLHHQNFILYHKDQR